MRDGQYNVKPLKKTRRTADFLQKCGIDLIVGNHEHVIHEFERKRAKLITYSLGNFVSDTGIFRKPFDKMSEYSVLLNVYLQKENEEIRINKETFTICKTVADGEKKVKVKRLYDIINECGDEKEKVKLMLDNKKIVNIVTKQDIEVDDIQEEYIVE